MKNKFMKLLGIGLIAAMAFSLAACSSGDSSANERTEQTEETGGTEGTDDSEDSDGSEGADNADVESNGTKVGVAMPTKDLQRWNQDGENIKVQLEAAGYEVDLQYANNDVATQVSQIETLIANDCDVLVIASIDGGSLSDPLEKAKEAEIPVIAYDRLIKNTDAVTYYATFDNYRIGQMQGEYIKEQLDLDNQDGPFTLEIFGGDPGDNNAHLYYDGAMDVLKPYIDDGKLDVKSGSVDFAEVATANWATETAQSRMDAILASNYADGTTLNAVLCANDSTALGVENALDAAYTGEWPIITGQDCDVPNTKNIIAGKQAMSIFKDTRELAAQTVKMVDAILKGEEAEVNDTETYDNGVLVVPSYLCDPVFADKDNYKELLLDSGYYTEDQLK